MTVDLTRRIDNTTKTAACADDLAVAGKIFN